MPEPDLLALCEQLDGLRAAATPGPWREESTGGRSFEGEYWAEFGVACGDTDPFTVGDDDQSQADAALIVAAVNAVPALTAAVRGLLADRDTLARVAALAERAEMHGYNLDPDDVLAVLGRAS